MPCSCDGYREDDERRTRDALENERKLRCRAQSLVHKLAKLLESSNGLPVELREAVELERRALLLHKRAESERDALAVDGKANAVLYRMIEIRNLGGTPNESVIQEEQALRQEYARLKDLSDAELLG